MKPCIISYCFVPKAFIWSGSVTDLCLEHEACINFETQTTPCIFKKTQILRVENAKSIFTLVLVSIKKL